jgi:hypothetical protein
MLRPAKRKTKDPRGEWVNERGRETEKSHIALPRNKHTTQIFDAAAAAFLPWLLAKVLMYH